MSDKASRDIAIVFTALSLGAACLYGVVVYLSRAGVLGFSMEQSGIMPDSIPGAVLWFVLRGFGPALAGVTALWIVQGSGAVRDLGRSVARWRIRPTLYLAAMFGIVIQGAALAVMAMVGELHAVPVNAAKFVVFFFAMFVLDGPLGEEVGWRGTLLPALLGRHGAIGAALIVGVIWYLWHVPLYAADHKLEDALSQARFLYSCIALSLILTWLYLRSGRSTLLAIYAHAWSNYAVFVRIKAFAGSTSPLVPVTTFVVLTALALAALVALRHDRPHPGPAAGAPRVP
ncbi:MAG: CPBP family intramembrane metalloprotease [Gemmatimonadetes bacterium]|nr:CPBP family intramembrane metalloprotease [Gemmatimonadota bacterium]